MEERSAANAWIKRIHSARTQIHIDADILQRRSNMKSWRKIFDERNLSPETVPPIKNCTQP